MHWISSPCSPKQGRRSAGFSSHGWKCASAGDRVGGSGAFSESFSAAGRGVSARLGVGGKVLPIVAATADGDGNDRLLCADWLFGAKIPGTPPRQSPLTIMCISTAELAAGPLNLAHRNAKSYPHFSQVSSTTMCRPISGTWYHLLSPNLSLSLCTYAARTFSLPFGSPKCKTLE